MVASPTSRRKPSPDFGHRPQQYPPTSASENGELDYRNVAADPLILAEADKRKPITDDLQATVMELLALYRESK